MPGTWFPLKYWFDEMNNKGIKKRKGEGKERADKLGNHRGLRTGLLLLCCLLGLRAAASPKSPTQDSAAGLPQPVARCGISNLPSKMISIKSVPSNSRKQSLDRYIFCKHHWNNSVIFLTNQVGKKGCLY